jgi:hypothetical protein
MQTDFTFPDTGITVKIRKVSPMILADINAAFPEPKPPENEVDYGEPLGKVMERNYSDPSYKVALQERNAKVFQALQRTMILRGVEVEGDAWKKEVEDYREFMQKETGTPLEETNDLVVYVLRLCVGSQEDLTDLISAITTRSQPTQEAVERAKASFRSKV